LKISFYNPIPVFSAKVNLVIGSFEKDAFQIRCVHSTILSVTAKENSGTSPENGTLPKDAIMNLVNAK